MYFLLSTKRIPVLYIFGREAIDLENCMAAFKSIYPDKHTHTLIMYDVRYSYVVGALMPQALSVHLKQCNLF